MSDWELMDFFEDDRIELFRLRTDLRATRDIASAVPEQATAHHQTMLAWRADTKALMPNRK